MNGELPKIVLINLNDHNATAANNYTAPSAPLGGGEFTLQGPKDCKGKTATLQRLMANGSDAVTGATFDGYNYNYELDNEIPVLLNNITRGESVKVGRKSDLKVGVPDSSAVLLSFR